MTLPAFPIETAAPASTAPDWVGRLQAWAAVAGERSPEEAWLHRMTDQSLALLRHPGPRTAQDLLVQEAAWLGPVPAHVVGAVASLMEAFGWDVGFTLTLEQSMGTPHRNEKSVPSDETLLEWLFFHYAEPPSLPPGVAWPATADAFRAFDAQHRPVRNQEWLAAWMVAHGDNPWAHPDGKARAILAFQRAVRNGHSAVAIQMLRLPGSPSVTEALHDRRSDHFGQSLVQKWQHGWNQGRFMFDRQECDEATREALPFLTGAFPDLHFKDDFWLRMPPNVFEAAVAGGLVDTATSLRLDAAAMGPTPPVDGILDTVQIRARLPTSQWSSERLQDEERAALVRRNLHLAESGKEQRDDGDWNPRSVAWLERQVPVNGPWTGTWSLLTSNALRRVLEQRDFTQERFRVGCRPASWRHLFPDGLPSGALALLLDEPLGNGLNARGLWALALMGELADPDIAMEDPFGDLCGEADLFGIADWAAFADAALDPALEATEWLVAKDFPTGGLCSAWDRWLTRCPVPHERTDAIARLLAILGSVRITWWVSDAEDHTLYFDPWGRLMCTLYKALLSHHLVEEDLSGMLSVSDMTPASFEFLLARQTTKELNVVLSWITSLDPAPAWATSRLEAWLNALPTPPQPQDGLDYRLGPEGRAAARQWLLDRRLATGGLAQADARPRL